MSEKSETRKWNSKDVLLEGLWARLARHSRGAFAGRAFIVEQITTILSIEWL